jgi:hypothetical protein
MKKVLAKIFSGGRRAPFWISLSFVAAGAAAVPLQEARVSQVIQDVRLLEAHAAPRPAVVNDKVIFGSAVRTGVESRTELTFKDLTITRLGANTIFSFTAGARQAELIQGAILLQVPPNAAPVRANTTAITVAVTGGTALLATGPPTKFMVLEGIGTIYPRGHPEKAVTVHGGEMVTAENGRISNPEKFDVKLVLETSPLLLDFPPLANLPLILAVVDQQLAEQQLAGTTTQPLAKNLIDVIDVTDQNANANPAVVEVRAETPTPSPTITPPPTPSKFGTPSTIALPNPYVITSGTVITTDPSITTNGVTDYGKIYRGPTDDGAFSLWAFGSTSAFDTALGIDNFFADPNRFPIAAFKFRSLSLSGNPIIDTSNGGVTKLALIGVNGITSGPPGGTLTFTGLDLLALGTVNGSISLTSDVSFQDISVLAMYARGASSDLILASPISNIGTLELAAEGSIQLTNPGTMSVGEFHATAGDDLTLQIGGSLLLNGKVRLNALVLPGTTVASGANLTLNVTGDYTNNSATEFSRFAITNQGHIGTGGNIAVDITGNLTATGLGSATDFPAPGDVELLVQNTNAQIDNGGNLNLTVNGNVQVNGLVAYLQNYDETANPAGHIGTGGNIDIEIGGNLNATSYVDVFLNNRGGGMINSGGNLTFNVGGALTIGADPTGVSAEFFISNRYDDSAGNTTPSFIGSDVSLFLHAASIDMAGILYASGISNILGSVINGNATVTWDVPGNVMIQGTTPITDSLSGAFWVISNNAPPGYQFTPPSGGTIHGNATLTLNIGGDLSIAGDASIEILNQRNFQSTVPSGGTIDSDATLNISAANFSVGGELDVDIRNRNNGIGSGTGGSIGGNAAINLNLSGDLAVTGSDPNSGGVPGDAYIYIANENDVGGSGGFIGGDATIDLNIVNASIAGLFDVKIDNFSGGTIGGDAAINVSAANITANSLLAQIDNSNGGSIGGTTNVAVNVTNDVTAPGGVTLQILNGNGGHIGTGAAGDGVLYSVGGSTSTTNLTEYIDNSNGGAIDNGGDVTLHTVGLVMLDGGLVLEVDNFNGGIINTGANVTAHFVGDVTATAGQFHSLNWNLLNGSGFFNPTATGGTIGTGGDINVTFDGNASTTGTSTTGSISAQIENGNGGSIGTGGNISMTVGGNLNAGPLFLVTENQGGHIGTGGNMTLQVAGDITTQGDANFQIFNNDNGSGPGTIDLDATINVNAANISTGGNLDAEIDNYSGGSVGGNAIINFAALGNVHGQGTAFLQIVNSSGGHIGGNAILDVSTGGDFSATGDLFARIYNDNGGGFIGGDARINFSANTISTGGSDPFPLAIQNLNGGHIVGDADIELIAPGGITANSFATTIDNSIGGMIDSNALINVSVGNTNLQGGAIFAIFNQGGGTIGGDATINMNVSGNATVTNDATVAIYGSDGAASAAININGGNYNAGGQFLTYIDGDGMITFNNASGHADVLKVGALGTNGVVNIGGGILSADTELKLYANGSNGALNFLSNVTLGGSAVKILAANTINILDGVVVTIGGATPAEVYTTNANYTGFGGNGTTTGTFAGAGANNPLPLNQAPPFGAPPPSPSRRGNITTINVSNTADLLALLDGALVGPDGRITISDSRNTTNLRNLSRIDMNGLPRGARRMLINEMRERSTMRAGGRRIL